MTKRLLSLAFVVILAAMYIPAVLAEDNSPDPNAGYYYVYTDDGKKLNVRDSVHHGKVVGRIPYGTRIYVEGFTDDTWAQIIYRYNKPGYGVGDYACFVQRRFLMKNEPAPFNPNNRPSGSSSSAGSSGSKDYAKIFSAMNAEYRTGKLVSQQFNVYARPSRASGFVNLRWGPSSDTERIATCPQGKLLTVIAETKNWYQVQDPETGMIGFISKKYVTIK